MVAVDTILPLFVLKTFPLESHRQRPKLPRHHHPVSAEHVHRHAIGRLRRESHVVVGFCDGHADFGLGWGLCKDDTVTSQALLVVFLVLIDRCVRAYSRLLNTRTRETSYFLLFPDDVGIHLLKTTIPPRGLGLDMMP